MGRRKRGEVYKRKDSPYFWLWYYDANGKRKIESTGVTKKGLADQLLDKRIMNALQIREGIKTDSDIVLTVLVEKYLKRIKVRKSYHTVRSYSSILKCFLEWARMNDISRAVDVDRSAIDGYVTYLREKGLKGWTCNNHAVAIRKLFYWAMDEKYISKNPAKKIELLSTSDSRPPRPLNEHEYTTFFRICAELYPKFSALYYTKAHTGLRFEELISLKWADVDIKEKVIKVMKPKGERGVELIPVHDNLIKVLNEVPKTSEYVFVDAKNRSWHGFKNPRRYRDRKIRETAYKIFEMMGISLRMHDFRTTFASMLVHKSVDAFTVQGLMRHTSIKTTQRYIKLFGTKLHSSIDKLQELDS